MVEHDHTPRPTRLVEHTADGAHELTPGCVVTRNATDPHNIELVGTDAWTVFTTGPIVRGWGYHMTDGWVPWANWAHHGRVVEGSREW